MKNVKHHTADKDLQVILGTLLRVGVLVSMIIVFIGGCMYMAEHGSEKVNYGTFVVDLTSYNSIPKIFSELFQFKSEAVIQFGILMLILTPILRVVFSVYSFLIEKDYLYVVIGIIVLGIILLSLNGGLAH